jgi:hypothetical protein
MSIRKKVCLAVLLSITVTVSAQTTPAGRQTETDEYTRYELLQPETASFKIYYEVTATAAGAKFYYNPIRKGSVASDENVFDAMSGKALHFEVVHGSEARKDALMSDADADTDYIKVTLARPVPENGQGRMVIVKTYQDAKSYYREGNKIVFKRSLGIPRDKIVLPPGYELVECNVPSQILTAQDGRVAISFMHAGAGEAPLELKAAKGAQIVPGASPSTERSWESPFPGETEAARLSERAHQDRDIVYFLQQPETHAFSLYHDYTESRTGVDNYVNVVRSGSKVSDPSAYILDTGEKLPSTIMSGADVLAAKLTSDDPIDPKGQVVVVKFGPVPSGQSIRLRISETYTAPASYRMAGEELVFDRSLGRPRNAVVLPSGWYCTASATPATVSQLPDGRIRLDYWDDRPEAVDVLVKARRRTN